MKRATMHRFEYRAPRFAVDLQARFTAEDSSIAGRCREIGEGGMTLEHSSLLPQDSLGIVSVTYSGRNIEIQACVAHAGTGQCGLKFIYETEAERRDMALFVAFLAAARKSAGSMPAKPDPDVTPIHARPVCSDPGLGPLLQRLAPGSARRA
jgi:hypothetical protein